MAAIAIQSVDADRVARGKNEYSARRHVAAIADCSADVITVAAAADGVIGRTAIAPQRTFTQLVRVRPPIAVANAGPDNVAG